MPEIANKCGDCSYFRKINAVGEVIPEKYIAGLGLVAIGFCSKPFGLLLGEVHVQTEASTRCQLPTKNSLVN